MSSSSETLRRMAETLRLYRPKYDSSRFEDSRIRDSAGELLPRNRAAVLICLFEGEKGEIRVILTKRSAKMSSGPGEVALPGGKWEEGDKSDAETALREAKEEIGLDPLLVDVVATLEPFYTKQNIVVFPIVGIIWDRNGINLVPNVAEVESIFDAPLEMFLKNENRREEKKVLMNHEYSIHFFDYQAGTETYTVWGFTAAILFRAASVVYQRPPAFEERMFKLWTRGRL